MAFIIPNATVTGSGQRFVNVNQAEPDSLDIEALGLRSNWVRSGGAVSISTGVLSVASGVAVIGGTPYPFNALSPQPTVALAINARFDLVVVRRTGSTAAVKVLPGLESATNPVLPQSRSTLENDNDFDSNSHFDPATDALLAAIYVTSATPTTENIVDKRVLDPRPVTRTDSAAPTNSPKDVVGDVVVHDEDVYVKINSTTWDTLVKSSDAVGFPVGSMFAWASNNSPNPIDKTLYLLCDGSEVSQTTYPDLFAVIGNSFGSAGAGLFRLPSLTDSRFIAGSTTVGGTGGADSVTLSTAQIPTHKHDVSVAAHSTLEHNSTDRTALDGSKATFTAKPEQAHTHAIAKHSHTGALVYRPYDTHNGFHAANNTDSTHYSGSTVDAFHIDALDVNEGNTNPWSSETDATEASRKTAFMDSSPVITGSGSSHQHLLDINHHTISAHSVTESNVGSGASIDIRPKFLNMRWFIRAA